MSIADMVFAGSIPEMYDTYLVPLFSSLIQPTSPSASARRLLGLFSRRLPAAPAGAFFFNVQDSIQQYGFARVITEAAGKLFLENPPLRIHHTVIMTWPRSKRICVRPASLPSGSKP